jgi:hypothetical protein
VKNSILENAAGQELAEFCEHVNEHLLSLKDFLIISATVNL